MEFTPYTMLTDIGWISLLLIIGNVLRNRLLVLQKLLLPAPITAGLLGLLLGQEVLGVIEWSSQVGTWAAPLFFGRNWLERGLFGWGWATAAVATGIALLKMVDPKLKSGTLNEYGVCYVGFAPFEIGMTILAPIAVIVGFTTSFGWVVTAIALGVLVIAFALRWVPAAKYGSPGHDASRRLIS